MKRHNRKSIRLKEYDYASGGMYFVTICTHNKECTFGEIVEGKMKLSGIGEIAQRCWRDIPNHFENVELDEFVIMPNHVHGIIIINKPDVGVQYIEPLQRKYQHIIPQSIGSIIRSYKAAVTRQCYRGNVKPFGWQRNYYDHIIRGDKDYHKIQEYIHHNPLKWTLDEENPID